MASLHQSLLVLAWLGLAACKTSSSASSEPAPTPASSASAASKAAAVATSQATTTSDLQQLCGGICQRSRELHCPNEAECSPQCLAMASLRPCAPQFLDFYRCLINEPREHWQCDEDGIAAIRDGYCEQQQERALSCVEASFSR